uniref:Ubiquitin carboxylterminal hydrolase and/or Fbox protein putative n=1 Tax=Albugo laibachii Nc14 TaxID=890382 RepID=F0VZD1_9STRA|nr:ubiquitin carboxylterminal hydrolase and/or Fbox protein putative [Albugo laibachii Nc14]|eukprot:CCA14161.1 ubiquitin carboxylterminal hydrolase and/or Fbox protein putative [Albugo laibachii Nc14]
MFGSLLCDGTDIDAYSFCYLYVEDISSTSTKVAEVESDNIGVQQAEFINAPSLIGSDRSDMLDKYVFMKALHPTSHKLEFIGKFGWSTITKLSTIMLCKRAAGILKCSWTNLDVYREEASPRLLSGPLSLSDAQSDVVKASDIVIFALKTTTEERALQSVMEGLLWSHYEYAAKMLEDWSSHPSLRDIEDVMHYFQIPRYCVRNAYHKCHQNARRTLEYIMEARQLGFACDKCGESDFLGPRYNCSVCHDYDKCQACSELQTHENTGPTEHGCSAHRETHTMTKILPVFHNFSKTKSS